MEDIIFFESEDHTSSKTMKIGLGLKNKGLESWFSQEVEKDNRSEIERTLESSKDDLSGLDALVLLRKNKSGGVEDPYSIVKAFRDLNPNGCVLFIVGTLDREGKRLLEQIEELNMPLYIASASGQMGPDIVQKRLHEMIDDWVKKLDVEVVNQEAEHKVYNITGVKGGCGSTTIAINLAHYLIQSGTVLIIENKNSLQYYSLDSNIEILQKENIQEEELSLLQQSYDYIILDDIEGFEDEKDHINRILVIDGSIESIERVKQFKSGVLVWNQALPEFMPREVIEKETGKEIILQINHDRAAFLQSAITMEELIKGIEALA